MLGCYTGNMETVEEQQQQQQMREEMCRVCDTDQREPEEVSTQEIRVSTYLCSS